MPVTRLHHDTELLYHVGGYIGTLVPTSPYIHRPLSLTRTSARGNMVNSEKIPCGREMRRKEGLFVIPR